VALILSAVPALAGDVETIEAILMQSAVPLTLSEDCGGIAGRTRPNNSSGWGRVNAWNAYLLAKTHETGIDDEYDEAIDGQAAARFRLFPNRPNPFNPSTQLTYEIPRPSRVAMHIHDALGRRVRTLVEVTHAEAGRFSIDWNGRDDDDRPLGSGVYFVRLESDGRVHASRRLTLVR
jgi:hypothetical protein